ncbi:methyl-accepting chemotaxis protein [Methylocapsa aurea]|uniref:methyl-accepting chemotaxis protein n=1 Tax=Methylocapsa aurea TaxID=663610 RepID=UPI00055A0A67|nr:methyl-accepting chemotaxis protein [Methylocapsa aurea]
MSLSNLAIVRKLGVGFACVLVAVALMSGTLFLILKSLDAAAVVNKKSYAVVEDLERALNAVSDQSRTSRGYIISREERLPAAYDEAVRLFAATMASARAAAASRPEILALLDKVELTGTTWRNEVGDPIIRLTRDMPTSERAADLSKTAHSTELFGAFKSAAAAARDRVGAWSADAQMTQDRLMNWAHLALIGGGLTSALVAFFIAWWLARAIARPVTGMTEAMNKLAGGDIAIAIPSLGEKNELGLMAGAVQTFKNAAIAKIAKDAKDAEDVKAWTKMDAERAAREAQEARQDQIAIDNIAAGLQRLADGDLVYRIETEFAPKTAKLRSDFNSAVEKLQQAMLSIRSNTDGIRSGSGEISSAADDLSRRTEQQAASLEETAATLDEITATVKNTAQGATHAHDIVSNTKTDADHSGDVVRKAIAAMGGIEKSSQQIGRFFLLALNAGVEAARAGDAGRGFAVVASEVRALAQRSAEAAKEIKSLISASTAQVGQGVDLVGETGKALGRIVVQVAEIDTVVAAIAASAQEQASALHQVNTAVNQMDQVTQQNAAMVEETTAAAHSLSQESEELARQLGRFQLGQEANVEPMRAKAARSVSRPASRPARPALKTLAGPSGGGALRKPDAAADESWEEF